MDDLDALARRLDVLEPTDKHQYQRQLRVLQSAWREVNGYPIGIHASKNGERPLGSRLAKPFAQDSLANFLNDPIRQVVREDVLDPRRSAGKLFGRPRIFNDLLSSQPLAFNLFAIPSRDIALATRWLRQMTGDTQLAVEAIEFEWSPGRRDPRYTNDRSAFDVFVRYHDGAGKPAFLGIEVKYHESMRDPPAKLRDRYEQLAQQIGWFKPESLAVLRDKPLQQVWRDHLLAASLLLADDFAHGQFVLIYPRVNTACERVITAYKACLTDAPCFAAWTLDDAVRALRDAKADSWIDEFHGRYLAIDKIDALMRPL